MPVTDLTTVLPNAADGPPANPPLKDETVGVGGSVDRAPRDIREPFDE